MTGRQRILVVSHGHPIESKGGGELAAYLLSGEFERQQHEVLFLAAARDPSSTRLGALRIPGNGARGNELIFDTASDYFHLGNVDLSCLAVFRRVLERFQPTVVNFHHYFRLGVEALREVKRYDPRVPVVVTLHEFLAICHRDGQMLKSDGRLCFRSSPEECAACFPGRSPAQFYARKRYVRTFFDLADAYVSPSRFLMSRYVDWGLPSTKFTQIENGQPPLANEGATPSGSPIDKAPDDRPRRRFAFFGQINPYKGVDLLLEAMSLLPRTDRSEMTLEIYGGGLQTQTEEFRAKVASLHDRVRGQVTFHGEYEPSQLGDLIGRCDWVVMPSIWWENSPLVIQEAFKYGKPVICAGIGGMAEKVKHMKTGLHFRAQNARDLADTLVVAARTPDLWRQFVDNISAPPKLSDCAREYLALFASLQPRSG
jgi:glycosyltransferase involved in cell wall biosynthesis